jgi:hypothetical protein
MDSLKDSLTIFVETISHNEVFANKVK